MTDLQDMSVADLCELQETFRYRAQQLKDDFAPLQAELERRFRPLIAEGQKRTGKSHGTLTEVLDNTNGYRLRHKTDLKVEWDTDELMKWAATQSWETVRHYCRVKIEVKEAHYKTIDPSSELKKTFAAARTEKVQPTKYEILAPSE